METKGAFVFRTRHDSECIGRKPLLVLCQNSRPPPPQWVVDSYNRVADVSRLRHPCDRGFSWCKSDGSLAFRMDLIDCSFPWLHHVVSCEMVFCPYSDHSAVLLNCPIPSPLPRGPGRWKLNVSILSNAEFVVAVKRFWSTWRLCESSFRSLQSWWDRGKEELRGLAVRFCCAKSQNLSSSRSLLTNLSNHLKWKIDQGFDSLLSILENVSAKIAELVLHEAEGAKVRSRIKWAEEGEASTSYFLRLEKKNGSDGWISAMKNADGSLATDIKFYLRFLGCLLFLFVLCL